MAPPKGYKHSARAKRLIRERNSQTKYTGFSLEWRLSFGRMFARVREGKAPSISFSRDAKGLRAFMDEMGPKPKTKDKWSVGRKDHTKGYEPGNVQWELHKFNSVKRRGTKYENAKTKIVKLKGPPKFTLGSPEWLRHQRKASKARWKKVRQGLIPLQPRGEHGYFTRRET